MRSGGQASFNDAVKRLGIKSPGLLWAHGNRLAEAQFIKVMRSGEGNPSTGFVVTSRGRLDFLRHRAAVIAMTDVLGIEEVA